MVKYLAKMMKNRPDRPLYVFYRYMRYLKSLGVVMLQWVAEVLFGLKVVNVLDCLELFPIGKIDRGKSDSM